MKLRATIARASFGLVLLLLVSEPLRLRAELTISSDFEGGSAEVISVNSQAQTIRISPAGRSERGMPNWWYLRVDGVETNKPLQLEVVALDASVPSDEGASTAPLNSNWTLPARATFSTDGKSWRHTAPGSRNGNRCIYGIAASSSTLWLAWGPPFTPREAWALCEQTMRDHAFAEVFTLAESRELRQVPGLRICEGSKPAAERPAVWVHARQHAWECGSSWVAVGLIEWLSSDNEQAKWVRQNAEIFIVPIMDVDHVATGDGGKHAHPQDHNRDWSESPHWPEVAAAQKRILALAKENRMAVFLDLHNPSAGARLQSFYVQYPPYVSERAAATQERFFELLRSGFGEIRLIDGKPSKPEHLPIWKCISAPWVVEHGNPDTVSLTVETPWNTPQGTTDGYREVGRRLATAISQFVRERP